MRMTTRGTWLFVFIGCALGLSSCGSTHAPNHDRALKQSTQQPSTSEPAPVAQPSVAADKAIEYPKALRGEWSLGQEPCRLPINPDADGKLIITAQNMDGYETKSKPTRVAFDPDKPNEWVITSTENYLGSQASEERQTFTLDGTKLNVQGDGYKETYVKCTP